jgi:uncharacterized protein
MLRLLDFVRPLWLAPLLALAAQPAAASAVPAAAPPAAAGDYQPRPAIWLLADEDTRIYLLGTVHILPPGFKWRSAAIDRLIAEADELVVETSDEPGGGGGAAADSLLLDPPSPILFRVPENRRRALKEAIQASGLPSEAFSRMPTWAASIMLGMAQLFGEYGVGGPEEAPGVEDVLEGAFRSARKPIRSVENGDEVLASLNRLPAEVQVELLLDAITPEPADAPVAANDDRLWATGDVEGVGKAFLKDFPPALFDVLVRRRNQAWTGWLARRLEKPGTVLFAVGTGHLAGDESVQEMLRRRGLTVTRFD